MKYSCVLLYAVALFGATAAADIEEDYYKLLNVKQDATNPQVRAVNPCMQMTTTQLLDVLLRCVARLVEVNPALCVLGVCGPTSSFAQFVAIALCTLRAESRNLHAVQLTRHRWKKKKVCGSPPCTLPVHPLVPAIALASIEDGSAHITDLALFRCKPKLGSWCS